MCAGTFSSCTHPVSPPPTVTIPDSVTITGPKTAIVDSVVKFTAHVNFIPSVPILYKWVFADTITIQSDSNKVRVFQDSGKQIFTVQVLRKTDSAALCLILDTILILDTVHHDTIVKLPPPDTCFKAMGPYTNPSEPSENDVSVLVHYCGLGLTITAQVYTMMGIPLGPPSTYTSDAQAWDRIPITAPPIAGTYYIVVTVGSYSSTSAYSVF